MAAAVTPRKFSNVISLHSFFVVYFALTAVSFSPNSLTAFPSGRQVSLTVRRSISLFAGNKKNVSASERERRDEEKRRQERKDDVAIGKTSAKKGEKDYPLDPKATEEQWLRQASNVEQQIYRLTEEGMEYLNSLRLEEADSAFDQVFKLRPNVYLWQAGIVKFYLGDLQGAADIFARNAATYESKFGSPASEERIWRDACEIKFLTSLSKRAKKSMEESGDISTMIRKIPEKKADDLFSIESRRVMKTARDLFSASVSSDISAELLARAKLRSISGSKLKKPLVDRKMWKLSSLFYLGLHYDTLGRDEDSKNCMKMALRLCPSSGKSEDITHTLPLLHMTVRDWFDDDDFEEDVIAKESVVPKDPGFSPSKPAFPTQSLAYADPAIEESIKEGVGQMKINELRAALRLRGLKIVGSKESLQERLFFSLMDDAGFNSGFAP